EDRRFADASAVSTARVHDAGCLCASRSAAARAKWEGGSEGAAGAGGKAGSNSVCGSANADGRGVSGNLGGSAACGTDRRARRFLRVGRKFIIGDANSREDAKCAENRGAAADAV